MSVLPSTVQWDFKSPYRMLRTNSSGIEYHSISKGALPNYFLITVIMTFGGEGVMPHDVLKLGVAKNSFMNRWEWLFVFCDDKKREGGRPKVNVTMTLKNPKIVGVRPL